MAVIASDLLEFLGRLPKFAYEGQSGEMIRKAELCAKAVIEYHLLLSLHKP